VFTNLKYTDHTTEHMFFLKKKQRLTKKKPYLVWQDSRSGRVWEMEVTDLLDLEVRLGRVACHARVGDWERDMAGLSRFVESGTQENGDEDWLFLSGLWGLRGGGWTTESVRDSEIESLRLKKDERFVNTESMNYDYVNLWGLRGGGWTQRTSIAC